MRKNCSRKAYLKRVGAAVLAGTMLLAAMPGTAFAAYAPVTGNPEDTYDAETWAKLQDNVLEYDEIPDLVHVYNSNISEIWKNLRETKEKLDRNIQELDSLSGNMKRLKDDAKDQGNMMIITPCRKSSLEKLRRVCAVRICTARKLWPAFRKAKSRLRKRLSP